MRRIVLVLMLLCAAPVGTASAAESWGLPGEELATFDGTVVDVLCALTGNCPAGCGKGKRQLGLRTADGRLILAMKNADPFAGATRDLLPYCGKTITADGVFVRNEGIVAFALQRLKPKGGDWRAANGFVRDWAARRGVAVDGPEAEAWFQHDPLVRDLIAADGKLGLGPGILPEK